MRAKISAQRQYYRSKTGTRIYTRGHITLSTELMQRCRLAIGDEVELVPHPEGLLLRKKQQ